jgi:hypothetical protein
MAYSIKPAARHCQSTRAPSFRRGRFSEMLRDLLFGD